MAKMKIENLLTLPNTFAGRKQAEANLVTAEKRTKRAQASVDNCPDKYTRWQTHLDKEDRLTYWEDVDTHWREEIERIDVEMEKESEENAALVERNNLADRYRREIEGCDLAKHGDVRSVLVEEYPDPVRTAILLKAMATEIRSLRNGTN